MKHAPIPTPISTLTWLEKRGKLVQPELTRDQKQSLLETFRLIDTAGCGHIGRDDLQEAFRSLDLDAFASKMGEIIGKGDEREGGNIDFLEFQHLMTNVLKGLDASGSNRSSPHGTPGSSMSLQLLATAYRRRKNLHGVMHDTVFRRQLVRQSERDMAR